jgi:Gpi18-like mannosyltransferase
MGSEAYHLLTVCHVRIEFRMYFQTPLCNIYFRDALCTFQRKALKLEQNSAIGTTGPHMLPNYQTI